MKRRRFKSTNIYESFSDVSLLMLATFIFLMVTILITSRMAQEYEVPKLKAEIETLKNKLAASELDKQSFSSALEEMVVAGEGSASALDKVVETATFGRKDFDLFIKGLKDLPGSDLHLIIDASGSMHGLTTFLIPILRAVVIRSNKQLAAITWFSDGMAETYTGSLGEMFDKLMSGAPFGGNRETIGKALRVAARNAHAPGAYILVGDEPSDDIINYSDIPSPVFTLPLGRSDPETNQEYKKIAEKTGGQMLHLDFK